MIGARFFQASLCVFDLAQIDELLTEKIDAIEAKIAKSKACARERLREHLAALDKEIDDGKLYEFVAAKHAKFGQTKTHD